MKYLSAVLCFLLSMVVAAPLCAQIEATEGMRHHARSHTMEGMDTLEMGSSFSPSLPMGRDGSGTSWAPDTSPVYAYMVHAKKWEFMFHGSIFVGFDKQDIFNSGARGGQRFSAPNWFMGMAQRKVGEKDLFTFEMMLSLDLLTEGGQGYPLLFQSGETWDGKAILDHQHPHDLFSGLSVGYTHAFNKDVDLTAYIGYPGEPALGPGAFMHRLSAINNPDAPIAHHWQDATHITYGVGTLGIRWKWLKAEGSIFTGREPDETRYDFDRPRFDSYSYRLSVNPHKEVSIQFSQGFIHQPEALDTGVNVIRYTLSLIHTHVFSRKDAWISSTFVWGLNNNRPGFMEHSILAESNLQWDRFALYTRYEWVQKDPYELGLTQYIPQYYANQTFNIHAITIGTSARIFQIINTNLVFGFQFTFNIPDQKLQSLYGNVPIATQVYLHITPAMMKMKMKKATDMPMSMPMN